MNAMKVLLLTVLVLVCQTSFASDEQTVIRLSEPVEVTAEFEIFGAPLDDAATRVSLGRIAAGDESLIGVTVGVETQVKEVCQKKGCFFIAQDGDSIVRVSFKDYGFFVPTDISGKRVTLVGEVVAKDVTTDEAEHFAADLGGEDATITPGKTLEIVAVSVRIPRES